MSATPIWNAHDLQFINRCGIATFDFAAEQAKHQADRNAAMRAFERRQKRDALLMALVWDSLLLATVAFWACVYFALHHWFAGHHWLSKL